MATRGTAERSESGASMSKYDVEVEKRLQELESEIAVLKKKLEEHEHVTSAAAPAAGIEEKFDTLVGILKKAPGLNIEKLSKGTL